MLCNVFFVQAEDGIRDLVRSRGLGDVYKRQVMSLAFSLLAMHCFRFPQVGIAIVLAHVWR